MVKEGTYRKGLAKREEILQAALEVFAIEGYRGTSLREVAARTGVTQAGLLYYFGTREALLAEVLRKREELGRESDPEPGTSASMSRALKRNARVPGLVRLHSVLAAQASDPEHPARDFFVARYGSLRGRISQDVAKLAKERRLAVDADRLAAILIALADGMQLQWMLDDTMDMAEHFDYLLALLGLGPEGLGVGSAAGSDPGSAN